MPEKSDGFIRWRCKSCNQKLKVKDTFEGGNVIQCPRCGANVNVPMANIEAIAAGADMPETGQPGRIQIDREKLMHALKGDEATEPGAPGTSGSTPSVRNDAYTGAGYSRIEQLGQLAASLIKIDEATMGEVQRLYRNADLGPKEREAQIRGAGDARRAEIKRLVQNRLAGMRMQLAHLEGSRERLGMSERSDLAKLQVAVEALDFYTRYILGIEL
jgi:phage FluMu protein Com